MTFKDLCRCFLPQDTRSVEITSAWSLIILSVFLICTKETPESMSALHPAEFWSTLTFLFGTLHLYSLLRLTKEEHTRLVISWVSGTFWVWVGLSSGMGSSGDIVALVLGVGCFKAFLTNTMIASKKWEN